MNFFEVLAMAVLQGLTEFLPISSSGHLVLAESLFGDRTVDSLGLILMLHLATACAAVVFYRREVLDIARSILPSPKAEERAVRRGRRTLLLVIIASIPTGLAGFTLSGFFEGLFHAPERVALSLFVTGLILMAASLAGEGSTPIEELPWWKALVVGAAQGVAIIPGISRSGTTIAASLLLGLRRSDAVEFSFLLLLPATAGAALYEATRLASLGEGNLPTAAAGFAAAAAVGYASIYLVLRWTKKGKLWYFGIYCWLAAAITAVAGRLG